MSCFILSNEKLSILARAVRTVITGGVNYCGFEGSKNATRLIGICKDEYDDTSEAALFNVLADLNEAAYYSRYREYAEPEYFLFNTTAPEYVTPIKYKNGAYIITPEHYKLLKLLNCYIYQVSERDTDKSEVKAILEDIRDSLGDMILYNSPEYIKAPWG